MWPYFLQIHKLQEMLTTKRLKKRYALLVVLVLAAGFGTGAFAQQDSLSVSVNGNSFIQGDSIPFEVSLPGYASIAKTATIQLWIENVQTGRRWKFRYPLINGYIAAKLAVDSSMPDGAYAFNFMLQKTFFSLSGHAENISKKDKVLNYVMIARNKQTVVDFVDLNEQQSFSIRNLLFQDSAFIIFADPKLKHRNNSLLVNIQTPLDSAFTPLYTVTRFVHIGKTALPAEVKPVDTSAYQFSAGNTLYKIILPELVLKSRSNKKLEDFDRENSTGAFSGQDAIILDGIGSDEIANAPDLYTYLSIKVGGLRLETDNNTGNQSFTWRGQPVDMYINEIKLDPDVPVWINPSDIAMIKVFRPGTSLSADTGAGGSIAIYTKTDQYNKATNRNYSFYILGYTGQEATWKN